MTTLQISMSNLEDTVGAVQDGMMTLEIQNDEMQLRLTELEETILGTITVPYLNKYRSMLLSKVGQKQDQVILRMKFKICALFLKIQFHGWPVSVHLVAMEAPASTSTSILSSVCAELVTMETYVSTVSSARAFLLDPI